MDDRLVSVVVLNHNGADELKTCLESLLGQSYPRVELLVADNGSTDGSETVATSLGVRFMRMKANLGFSRANNAAARVARGEFVFFVNNDMRFDPDCLARLVAAIESGPEVFCADPTQLNWEGTATVHGKTVVSAGGIRDWLPFVRVSYTRRSGQVAAVPWGCAGSMMVRRDQFLQLRGFDWRFFLDFEDMDICLRAWRRGWRSVYVPSAVLYHRVGADSARARREPNWRLYGMERNLEQVVLKHFPLASGARVLFAKWMVAVVLAARGDSPKAQAIWRALPWGIAQLPTTLRLRLEISSNSSASGRTLQDFLDGETLGSAPSGGMGNQGVR